MYDIAIECYTFQLKIFSTSDELYHISYISNNFRNVPNAAFKDKMSRLKMNISV